MKKVWIVAVVLMFCSTAGSSMAQQSTVHMKEVVVTATKTEKEQKDVTQSVTVITAEEIKRSNASTAAEVLQQAAGAVVDNYGTLGSVNSIHLRGSSAGQVVVLLDGMRLNSPLNGQVDLSAVPISVEDIDRIEIVRGASSALYGADAVGGVVNIITKKPVSTVSRISGAYGSHGYDSLQLNTSSRQGSGFYTMTGTRETSDGYRLNSNLEQWIVNGRAGYDFSKATSIDLTANYISKENGVPGSVQFPSPHARQQERELVLGTSLKTQFSKVLDFKVSASQSEDQLGYKDPDTINFITMLPAPTDSRHNTVTRIGDVQVNWLTGPWSFFSLGYEQRKDDLTSTDAGLHETTNKAWYIQDEVSLGDTFIIVIGGRQDKHSVYGNHFSPRTSARYIIPGSDSIIRASYGKSFRAPTFGDLYWNDPYTVGNPNLKPEFSKEYETGFEQPLGPGSRVKLTGFQRKVTDQINYVAGAFPAPGTFENIGNVDIKGVEAEAAFRVSTTVSVGANYGYLKAVDQKSGDKLYSPLYPKNQAKGYIDIVLDTDVHLYTAARMVEYYVQQGEPLWHYTVVDAKLAQKFGRRADAKGEIYFAVTNIFDRKYDAYRYSGSYYPAAPREIRGGISYPF